MAQPHTFNQHFPSRVTLILQLAAVFIMPFLLSARRADAQTASPGSTSPTGWDRADVDFEHSGGAFVLTNVLFDDGSSREESKDSASCKYVCYHSHKKNLVKPVRLPVRE